MLKPSVANTGCIMSGGGRSGLGTMSASILRLLSALQADTDTVVDFQILALT